jgi:hypothetical protein
MSLYAVHSVCRKALNNQGFREALNADPVAALKSFDLTPEERDALLAGDVVALYGRGAHEYALLWLGRAEVFGLTVPEYSKRIKLAEPHYIY